MDRDIQEMFEKQNPNGEFNSENEKLNHIVDYSKQRYKTANRKENEVFSSNMRKQEEIEEKERFRKLNKYDSVYKTNAKLRYGYKGNEEQQTHLNNTYGVDGGSIFHRLINTADALVNGRTGISPSVNKFMEQHGNEPITQMIISRTPLSGALVGTVNLLSPNFQKKNQETLYHLCLIIKTDKSNFVLEKNSGIEISNYKASQKAQNLHVSIPTGLTLNILLERTKQLMGNNFLSYSSKDNNCGDFVIAVLKSNRLANSSNLLFVEQIIDHLFTDNFRKVSNTITGIASKIDIIRQGGKVE